MTDIIFHGSRDILIFENIRGTMKYAFRDYRLNFHVLYVKEEMNEAVTHR